MISYKSNQYSVPPEYIGKKLKLQVYDDQLHVYYSTNLFNGKSYRLKDHFKQEED